MKLRKVVGKALASNLSVCLYQREGNICLLIPESVSDWGDWKVTFWKRIADTFSFLLYSLCRKSPPPNPTHSNAAWEQIMVITHPCQSCRNCSLCIKAGLPIRETTGRAGNCERQHSLRFFFLYRGWCREVCTCFILLTLPSPTGRQAGTHQSCLTDVKAGGAESATCMVFAAGFYPYL